MVKNNWSSGTGDALSLLIKYMQMLHVEFQEAWAQGLPRLLAVSASEVSLYVEEGVKWHYQN